MSAVLKRISFISSDNVSSKTSLSELSDILIILLPLPPVKNLLFNESNVYSRVFLKDFINLLYNYSLYRIMPGGKMLELNKPYSPKTHEIFVTQNIIFIKNN